jgi:LacI family transcriptional regulator
MAAGIREVAAAAGVSVGTVSNVLNAPEKVAGVTASRVHKAMRDLGFVRNEAARQLKAGHSRCIALLVLDVGNPFFTDLARAVQQRAAEYNLTVLLGASDESPDVEAAYIELFDEQRVFGMLVSPVGDDLGRIEELNRRGTPVVLVDRDGNGTPFPSVAVDNVAGGEMAARHLYASGYRRIAFIGGSLELRQVHDRLQGARQVTETTPGAQLEVISTPDPTVRSGRTVGEQLRRRSAPDRPEAVFCANDLLAIGLLQAITAPGGLRIPDDLAVIGYDDIDFARSTAVPLSSIGQPATMMGATAVDLLVEAAQHDHTRAPATPAQVLFQPELHPRESTMAATKGV